MAKARKRKKKAVESIYTSKITRNSQVTIPLEVREALDLREGQVVQFEVKGDEIRIVPLVPLRREKKGG